MITAWIPSTRKPISRYRGAWVIAVKSEPAAICPITRNSIKVAISVEPATLPSGVCAAISPSTETIRMVQVVESTAWPYSGRPSLTQIARIETSTETNRTERNEEHTSELQSRGQLVCRLPLEQK